MEEIELAKAIHAPNHRRHYLVRKNWHQSQKKGKEKIDGDLLHVIQEWVKKIKKAFAIRRWAALTALSST